MSGFEPEPRPGQGNEYKYIAEVFFIVEEAGLEPTLTAPKAKKLSAVCNLWNRLLSYVVLTIRRFLKIVEIL